MNHLFFNTQRSCKTFGYLTNVTIQVGMDHCIVQLIVYASCTIRTDAVAGKQALSEIMLKCDAF
jgi:hypothetical protein